MKPKTKNFQLVFFDFDGVILDSAKIKTEAFPQVFEHYPEHVDAITTFHINNQGLSRFKKFEWIYSHLLQKPLSEEESLTLAKKFSDIVLDKVLTCNEIKGSLDLLKALNHRKVKCVVASGTPFEELKVIIEKRGLAPLFTEVWGSPKTKEEIIELILEKYDVSNHDSLFLGDASTDYIAAKTKNIKFQAIYSDEMKAYWQNENQTPIDDLNKIIPMYFQNEN